MVTPCARQKNGCLGAWQTACGNGFTGAREALACGFQRSQYGDLFAANQPGTGRGGEGGGWEEEEEGSYNWVGGRVGSLAVVREDNWMWRSLSECGGDVKCDGGERCGNDRISCTSGEMEVDLLEMVMG